MICPVCCGTKRLVEIRCPADCVYLASARQHPAAVVRRQQERDVARLVPTLRGLTERQHQLFFLLHSTIARHTPEGFARLLDSDVAEGAAALAATLETAERGVIYEHTPASAPARSLVVDMKALLARLREERVAVYDGEVAIVLRAIERGARDTRTPEEGERAYLELMARLVDAGASPGAPAEPAPASSVILP
jgi:hypothetical protein